ncbi:uncharacterized protein LOC106153577 isoform X2 [Lingula anatina]|uniref:Uncharacterized protein LOC106153577 isoform X2 n=1 Tax=Lingula anatina TaxID=7574 RepID=A0A1S3HD19_LINAN|nr:uncharacterized protein LOC106153577 isoform X2 [Lingula anatina]|eukprot:XP_013383009.1 uncharacterized protein LOC106153577 isoform X2 [Lingula anatina]
MGTLLFGSVAFLVVHICVGSLLCDWKQFDDPCSWSNYDKLDNFRRNQNEHLMAGQKPLCDNALMSKWFRFIGRAGDRMADSTANLMSGSCNTNWPIFLKGTHPKLSDLSCNEIVPSEGCIVYDGKTYCRADRVTIDIKIKKCCVGAAEFFIYRSSHDVICDSAFCGAGSSLQCNGSDVLYVDKDENAEKCKAPYPRMIGLPKISDPEVDDDDFAIYCQVTFDANSGNNESALFNVQFLFNGENALHAIADCSTGFRAKLTSKSIAKHIGKHVNCRVNASWKESRRQETSFTYSANSYFAGIKVFKYQTFEEVRNINLSKDKMQPFRIELATYIPITKTSHSFDMLNFTLSTASDISTEACYSAFSQWTGDETFPIRSSPAITVYPVFDGSIKPEGSLRLLTFDRQSLNTPWDPNKSIWHGFRLGGIPITLKEASPGECTSVTDPHFKTFDNTLFDNQIKGEFLLSKLNKVEEGIFFEVRAKHWSCLNDDIACNCGVAARENDDIFIVDLCHSTWQQHKNKNVAPLIWYRGIGNCQDESCPAEGADIYKDTTGKDFTISFPSGARVRAKINPRWGLDLTVHVPSYFEANGLEGLCGDYGPKPDRTSNDFHLEQKSGVNKGRETSYCHCQKNGIVCDYNRLITDRGNIEQLTHITPYTPKQRPNNKRHKRDLRAGEDITDDEIKDFSRYEYEFDFNEDNVVPVMKDWPTLGGKTKKQVEDHCDRTIQASPIYNLCQNVPEFDFDSSRRQCIEDIKLTDDYKFADMAVASMESFCLLTAEKIKPPPPPPPTEIPVSPTRGPLLPALPATFTTPKSTVKPFIMPDLDTIKKWICPNQCSDHGDCVDGTCQCHQNFTSNDCSVEMDLAPKVYGIGDDGLCDIRQRRCEVINLDVSNAVDGANLTCRFVLNEVDFSTGKRLFQKSTFETVGKMLSFAEMVCPLPKQKIDTPLKETAIRGNPLQSFDLTISNDKQFFSAIPSNVTIYDSHCIECIGHACIRKSDACKINGYCYEDGETDPVHEACRSCNISVDLNGWTNTTEPTIPCAHCDGLPCKCAGAKWKCECNPGFVNALNGTCIDVDECKYQGACGPNSVCLNTRGSYRCQCNVGYRAVNRSYCTDIDECKSTNACLPTAACINVPGSFKCHCKPGYSGINCTDIDECTRMNPCDPYMDCINLPGSYECRFRTSGCPRRYENVHNKCLLIQNSNINFSDARMACLSESGDLVMIETIFEYKALITKIPRASGFYWVGVTDTETEGKWKFVNGADITYSPSWDPGHPAVSPNDDDCVAINSGSSYQYVDKKCSESFKFICQAPWHRQNIFG